MASYSITPHSTFTSTVSSIWFPFQGKPFSLLRKPPAEKTQPTSVAALPAIQTPLLSPPAFCFHLYISIYHIWVTSVLVCLLWYYTSCLLHLYISSLQKLPGECYRCNSCLRFWHLYSRANDLNKCNTTESRNSDLHFCISKAHRAWASETLGG